MTPAQTTPRRPLLATVRAVTHSAGFHGSDAGIGAGGMLALIVIGLGGALTLPTGVTSAIHDWCSTGI